MFEHPMVACFAKEDETGFRSGEVEDDTVSGKDS